MAYDERLAERIRVILAHREDLDERRMFGGIAFLLHGNMCCGVTNDDLMLRMSHEEAEQALAHPAARPMDFTGRPMRGFVYVGAPGVRTRRALEGWVTRSVAFADGLPPK